MYNIDGKFSLSYYPFEVLKEWFPINMYNWEWKAFKKAAAAKAGKTQNDGQELLIMNYDHPLQRKNNRKKKGI